jgi:hypothetical protein
LSRTFPRIGTSLQDQLVVALRKIIKHFRRSDRVRRNAVNQRTCHLLSQFGKGTARNRAPHQGILQHAQVDARLSRLSPQLRQMSDFQPTVLSDDDCLSVGDLSRNLGYNRFFLI